MDNTSKQLKLSHRLACLSMPDEELIPYVDSADSFLDMLTVVSDAQGRYYASGALLLRFLYNQDPWPTRQDIQRWRDELLDRGDITITPDGRDCYTGRTELIINIQRLCRFQRWSERPAIPKSVRAQVYETDGHACVKCGRTDSLQVDHIIPWSKGGAHEINNFQTLCKPCNISKGNKLEE